MYLHELCGSWMDHPFWNTSFLLKDPRDLRRIRKSSVRALWIDTAKGLDVEIQEDESPEEAQARVEEKFIDTTRASTVVATTELREELEVAAGICARAKSVVTSMFQEARMGAVAQTEQLEPLVEEITDSVRRNPGALISLARLKTQDDYTYLHSVAVCGLMAALARQLGMGAAQIREAGMAGLLHDIGKAAVPLEILNKPDKLTDQEFERIKSHPRAGHEMLAERGGVGEMVLDVCLHHHEKTNGCGYPDALSAEEISPFARMGAVCDVYDAITSERCYKRGWDPATAIRRMNEWSEGHFDNAVFQAFVKTVGVYPVGSLVRLKSGLLAVVCEVREDTLLAPRVKAFYSTRRKMRVPPRSIDFASAAVDDKIVRWEAREEWDFPDLDDLWRGQTTTTHSAV